MTAYLITGEPTAGECQSEEQMDEILTGYSTKTKGLIGRLSFKRQQLEGFTAAHRATEKEQGPLVWKLLRNVCVTSFIKSFYDHVSHSGLFK